MLKIIKKIVFGMAIFVAIASPVSCVSYEEVQVTDIKDLELQGFSSKEISISAQVEIANPNKYDISVTDSEFSISTDGNLLGSFKIDQQLELLESSREFHEVAFKLDMEDLSPNAQSTLLQIVLSGENKVNIKVEGYIEAKAFMLKRKFPISFEDEVEIGM